MSEGKRYQFGDFELNAVTGELHRRGVRVRLHVQPFQVLALLVERPGQLLTREQIRQALWPEGTFVDYEHGLNSAMSRVREALGDKASQPRYVETMARRGYRFLAPVTVVNGGSETVAAEQIEQVAFPEPAEANGSLLTRILAREEDLPRTAPATAALLFLLLQGMYLSFYVGSLANLGEVGDLLSVLPGSTWLQWAVEISACLLIAVRVFLTCAVMFRAPGLRTLYLRLWPAVLVADLAWALSPLLLLHHISFGLALACVVPLVYAPFAQRSLMLMGADRPWATQPGARPHSTAGMQPGGDAEKT